jgi:hypothetical protein
MFQVVACRKKYTPLAELPPKFLARCDSFRGFDPESPDCSARAEMLQFGNVAHEARLQLWKARLRAS